MYCFAIHSGMPGYLPNSTELYSFETLDEAKAAIRQAVYDWTKPGDERLPWAQFAKGPDASVWSFDIARGGSEYLSVAGLTETEYQTRMDEEG